MAINKVKKPRPYVPTSDKGCIIGVQTAQIAATGFHGKPVNTCPRSHSATAHAKANTIMPLGPARLHGA
ncbi:hypothetical protein JCM17845_27530 [Iodidimonas gelatinilytica]|uniref:Uncharacterized protein n=1 Tax=Iodidimonas gelatinilytica TaxID=1236966 RepID=A0A5A7N437_9PROT|nr:hypothetical protein JCM17845_27530 [Iodidimonas gelatinilytica]